MTDRDVDLMNKLIAAGGWLERAWRKHRPLIKMPMIGSLDPIIEAIQANRDAIKILKGDSIGRPDKKL